MSAPSLSMIVRRSVILGSLAMALVACDGASHSASDAGTTLILARSSDPEWLNPVAGHQHPDADLALFRLAEVALRFVDVTGAHRDSARLLKPAGMLRAGHWCDAQPRPWEFPRKADGG